MIKWWFKCHQNGEKMRFFSWSYPHVRPLEMIVWGYGLFSDRPKWGNVGNFLDWKFWKSYHGQKRQEDHQGKTFRKKHRKSRDFALNKDTSAKMCQKIPSQNISSGNGIFPLLNSKHFSEVSTKEMWRFSSWAPAWNHPAMNTPCISLHLSIYWCL